MQWWIYIIIYIISQIAGGLIGNFLPMPIIGSVLLAHLLAIVLVLILRPKKVERPADWRYKGMMALLMAPPLIVLVNLIQEWLPTLPSFIDEQSLSVLMHHPLGILSIALLAPISEELTFRAGILGSLSEGRSPWRAVLLSALIFAVAHMNPVQMPVAFVMGLLLGWAYWQTGSLLVPCLIHIMNNSLAVGLGLIYADPDISFTEVLGGSLGTGIALAVSAAWLLAVVYRLSKA